MTGFGLLGHSWEIAERSRAAVNLDASALPFYPGALQTAEGGTRTGGDARNRTYLAGHVRSSAADAIEVLCFDPQTSGGLLASVAPDDSTALVADDADALARAILDCHRDDELWTRLSESARAELGRRPSATMQTLGRLLSE
ncbi:MAG: hypothetical protein NVSMB16_05110 [Acidimicrobiales bacterium]